MASPYYKIQVITPQGSQYRGEIVHALIPSENGFVGVLANHAPYITSSPGGRFEIRGRDGQEKKYKVGAGFFEVAHNRATFLTQTFSDAS